MRVIIKDLVKKFGVTLALKGISLEVQSQELFFLLGPSGCGKTTLLRVIAGFYQPDGGSLQFGEKSLAGVPPHQRNTGMVFQNYALWPHLNVAQNVGYGLDVRRLSAAEKKRRVGEALEIVRMSQYADRMPPQLSGGQQQRVALARALVIKPDVLLLDEPLSNLDAKLRLEMREEIRRIHAETRITTIYVTHDQKEALSLAARVAVLRDGQIEQIGDPRTIYRSPANRFVADFIGETNWLEAVVQSMAGQEMECATAFGVFHALADARWVAGAKVQLGFRPESVEIGAGECNHLATVVKHVCYLGEIEQYELELAGGKRIKAFEQNPRQIRPIGATLKVFVRPQNVMVLAGPPPGQAQ
jgi:iron(III) transport system ATP-binding protein